MEESQMGVGIEEQGGSSNQIIQQLPFRTFFYLF